MAWRKYINGMFLGVIIFTGVIAVLVNFTSPDSGYVTYGPLYLSFFLSLLFFFTIAGFYMRRRMTNNEILYRNLKIAFRQGALIALYFTMLLIMNAAELLNWWDAILLASVLIFLDVFFKERI